MSNYYGKRPNGGRTTYSIKKIGLVILVIIVIVILAVGIKLKSSSKNIKETRNAELEGYTVTDMVDKAAGESVKGPTRSAGKVAYITIDDGPSQYTDKFINVLNKYNAKATFFMIDGNMKEYKESVRNIVKNGDTGGLHSVSHDIHKLYKSEHSAKDEFDQCKRTFKEITGKDTNVIRIPYGSKPYTPVKTYDSLVSAGYKIWDWGIDTQDWKYKDPKHITDTVKNYDNGNHDIVILIHDKKYSFEAIEGIIKDLLSKGYELDAVNQNEKPHNFWLRNLSSEN